MFKVVYWFLYIVLYPFYRFRFVGKENIPEGAAVLCGNHTANIDAVFIVLANGPQRNFGIIGKEELFRFKPIAAFFHWIGGVPVKRDGGDLQAVRVSLSILKAGKKLLLFPEGTRVKEGMAPVAPKSGAPMFALKCNAPLVPIYIPSGRKAFRKNTVVIGKPYLPEFDGKPGHDDYQRMAEDLMQRIQALAHGELNK
ncbi:MAG: 1-acyl-sn-glycerol-3-phosphate acyltransferase [Clostridia bacterium]|nr:1-acyl-sn-glycerol-3-phosphate acyltransferase [Clostridia bacterium]